MFNWIQSLDSFFQKTRLRYLGLGLLLAWVYSTWFSDGIFDPEGELGVSSLRVSILCSSIGLFALSFRPNKRKPLSLKILCASGTIVTLTTLSFLLLQALPPYFIYITSAIGGLASSTLWIGWGETFCAIDAESTEAAIPSSLGAFIVAVLLIFLIPSPFSGILAGLFPLISTLLLSLSLNALEPTFMFNEPKTPFKYVLPSLSKLAFCSMVCSIATGCVTTSFLPSALLLPDNSLILSYTIGGVVAGLIVVLTIAFASRFDFSSLYDIAIPLIVIALALRALGGSVCITAASIIACSAVLYVEVFFFVIFARITSKGLCLPSETFGIFRSVVQLGFFVGAFIGTYLAIPWGLPVYLALICLCVIMLPLFMHLQKSLVGSDFQRSFEGPGDLHKFETADTQKGLDSPAAQCASSTEERTETVNRLSELADKYKLSPREREIFAYFARGRSVPYIREELMVSKSTVETHVKHIYSKMGVHSKQELIDLIEAENNS